MTKKTNKHALLRRNFYHWVVAQLVANIEEYHNGIYVVINGTGRWVVPVIAYVITDWPEGQCMTLVGGGATKSYCNCRVCLCPTALFIRTLESLNYRMRTQHETQAKEAHFNQPGVTQAAKEAEERATSQVR